MFVHLGAFLKKRVDDKELLSFIIIEHLPLFLEGKKKLLSGFLSVNLKDTADNIINISVFTFVLFT